MLLRSSPPPPCVPQFPRRTRPLLSPRRCPFKARLLPRKGRGLSRTRRAAPPPGRRLGACFRRWAGSGEGGGRARAAAWGWAGGVAGTGGPWRSAAWGEGRAGPGLDSTPLPWWRRFFLPPPAEKADLPLGFLLCLGPAPSYRLRGGAAPRGRPWLGGKGTAPSPPWAASLGAGNGLGLLGRRRFEQLPRV